MTDNKFGYENPSRPDDVPSSDGSSGRKVRVQSRNPDILAEMSAVDGPIKIWPKPLYGGFDVEAPDFESFLITGATDKVVESNETLTHIWEDIDGFRIVLQLDESGDSLRVDRVD